MPSELTILFRLLVAGACGALVGLQAQLLHRPGGLRAHALAGMGAAMFCLSGVELADKPGDIIRIVQGVASGVGFIGAASVLRHEQSIQGVASAASIWIAAAIGCFCTGGWPEDRDRCRVRGSDRQQDQPACREAYASAFEEPARSVVILPEHVDRRATRVAPFAADQPVRSGAVVDGGRQSDRCLRGSRPGWSSPAH